MSQIVMNEGDEYRARIATGTTADAFFEKIYENANAIIGELEEHVKRFREQEEEKGIQYRIGNNIIAFCGERGQGKTSAMQTFSYRLKNKSQFYVLNSIDPSALRADESIVRILLSKLFNEFANSIKNFAKNNRSQDKADQMQRERDKILKKFSVCFRNVDYSVKERKDEFGLDDLEQLAQLGSSNKLREELQTLIGEFLEFQRKFCRHYECGDTGYYEYECEKYSQFLVIQIDDADMALNGVFKICEDIRNYFSLPNIIVLMAAEIEQLTDAILQEYVKKYHEIIAVEPDADNKKYYFEKCLKMANRYIEKMFPVGHRIELPQIRDYVKWNFNTITLEYHIYDKKKDNDRKNIFAEYSGICDDMHMQEQLLKMLYDRTGLVFIKNDQRLHFVLPRTMRELTHFVGMLQKMPIIDFEAAFTKKCEHTKNLRHNLDMFEHYFYNYWCANHLTEKTNIAFKEMHEELFKTEPCAGEMVSKYNESDREVRNAFIIMYSIILNKKFVEAVGHSELNTNLAAYLQDFIFDWDTEDLKLMRYEYDLSNFDENETERNVSEQKDLDFIPEKGKFDAAKVILAALYQYDQYEKLIWPIPETSDSLSSVDPSVQDTSEASNEKPDGSGRSMLIIGLKNLFGNLDVYYYITEQIDNVYLELNTNNKKYYTLSSIYNKIFEIMNINGMVVYLGLQNIAIARLGDYWKDLYDTGKSHYAKCFWANRLNDKRYRDLDHALLQEYKKAIIGMCDHIIRYIDDERSWDHSQSIDFRNPKDVGNQFKFYDAVFEKSNNYQYLEEKRDAINEALKNFNEKYVIQGKIEDINKQELREKITSIKESAEKASDLECGRTKRSRNKKSKR